MMAMSFGPLVMSVQRGLVALAMFIAVLVAISLARQRRVLVADTMLMVLVWGMLSARLVFVLRYWGDYMASPWSIVDIRDGGFDPLAGAIAAVLYAGWIAWRRTELRRPLGVAMTTGFSLWLMSSALFVVLENTSREMPDVQLATLGEVDTSLTALYDGRPMVVNLWATWCAPCRREMPVLQKAQEEYPEIQFIFVNQRESEWTVQEFLEEESLQLSNVILDAQGRLPEQLGTYALPTTLFYDANGDLVNSKLGEVSPATLRHALRTLIPKS